MTATIEWPHRSYPLLTFDYSHRDTFAFPVDTLTVRIEGIPAGQSATVEASGLPFLWVLSTPLADSTGVITGRVLVPDSIPEGDIPMTAISEGVEDAVADQLLQSRHFLRREVEYLSTESWLGVSHVTRTAPIYNQPNHTEPWGRSRCRRLIGRQAGDYAAYRVIIPIEGNYRINYFLARTGFGAIVRTLVDSIPDLPDYDTYTNINWYWTRSDTLTGQWHYLTTDTHIVKIEITGRNNAALDWQAVIDQIVMEWEPQAPPLERSLPLAVNGLTIHRTGEWIELRWQPRAAEAFEIYRSTQPDGTFEKCAKVAGDCYRYVDPQPLTGKGMQWFYEVVAQSVSAPDSMKSK
jgi:hypothetical protein